MIFDKPLAVEAVFKDFDYCLFQSDSAFSTLDALFRAKAQELPGLRQYPENDVVAFIWRNSPDVIVNQFGLTGTEASNFLDFYENLPVPAEAVLYPDTWITLERLQAAGVQMFLVTKGERSFQARKIAHVGIAPFFEEIHIVGHKGAQFMTKQAAFEGIMIRHSLEPSSIWTVGDGKEEMTAGHVLGHITVQTLRPGVEVFDKAHHHITSLDRLLPLLGIG